MSSKSLQYLVKAPALLLALLSVASASTAWAATQAPTESPAATDPPSIAKLCKLTGSGDKQDRVVANEFSILDTSDIVVIDAIGTGVSHGVCEHKDEEFWCSSSI